MPHMMPMEQAMPYMTPCYYMASDGSSWGMCPVAMPVIPGADPPVVPHVAPNMPTDAEKAMTPETPKKDPVKDPQIVGCLKATSPSSGKRWAISMMTMTPTIHGSANEELR